MRFELHLYIIGIFENFIWRTFAILFLLFQFSLFSNIVNVAINHHIKLRRDILRQLDK